VSNLETIAHASHFTALICQQVLNKSHLFPSTQSLPPSCSDSKAILLSQTPHSSKYCWYQWQCTDIVTFSCSHMTFNHCISLCVRVRVHCWLLSLLTAAGCCHCLLLATASYSTYYCTSTFIESCKFLLEVSQFFVSLTRIAMDESSRLLAEHPVLNEDSAVHAAACGQAQAALSADVQKDRTQVASHGSKNANCEQAAAEGTQPTTPLRKSSVSALASILDAPPGPGQQRAGLISRLCFLWLNPLIQLASHRSLRLSDLWPLDASAGAAVLVSRFERAWAVQQLKPAGKRSMSRALFSMFWPTLLFTGHTKSRCTS
jgi:hypothetical protein